MTPPACSPPPTPQGGPAGAPRLCVLIPVYNHGLTLETVINGARVHLPSIIVVDDGSTDSTREVLARRDDVERITFPFNRGKGAALRAGFAHAAALGYTHAVSLDADGQLPPAALPDFIQLSTAHPDALLVGVRDFRRANAPAARRRSNVASNFWFRLETGQRLRDTQCGYRCYPLAPVLAMPIGASRYAYELEVLVRAAWAGLPILPVPVDVDYAAPTSRLSHFRPGRDLLQVSFTHARLTFQALCLPRRIRHLAARGLLHHGSLAHRTRIVLRSFAD